MNKIEWKDLSRWEKDVIQDLRDMDDKRRDRCRGTIQDIAEAARADSECLKKRSELRLV
ncbi:MAG: hypothetical protein BMS9Abin06_0996 [Gammaproteobacteria bacterium]|nr:MAG: hypothetical protein BMS9Abin06_0996 [Gammaproteobacteria bacterium]